MPGSRDLFRHAAQVWKSRCETEKVDDVRRRAVETNDFRLCQIIVPRHVFEIWRKFTLIANRNLDHSPPRHLDRVHSGEKMPDLSFKVEGSRDRGVEGDQHRGVTRMNVENVPS